MLVKIVPWSSFTGSIIALVSRLLSLCSHFLKHIHLSCRRDSLLQYSCASCALVDQISPTSVLFPGRCGVVAAVVPVTQSGFRGNRSTIDMIFCLRQLQENALSRTDHCTWYLSTSVRRSIQLGGLDYGSY